MVNFVTKSYHTAEMGAPERNPESSPSGRLDGREVRRRIRRRNPHHRSAPRPVKNQRRSPDVQMYEPRKMPKSHDYSPDFCILSSSCMESCTIKRGEQCELRR